MYKSVIVLTAVLPCLVTIPAAGQDLIGPCQVRGANRAEGIHEQALFPRSHERRIERFLLDAAATPGAAVAVVAGGKVAYARGFGYRSLEDCVATTSATRFYIKSTTKHFLGMAAAVLHEQGAIELDAPISDYLPGLKFPEGRRPEQASIRSHLTHTHPTFSPGLNYRTAFPGNLPEADFVDYLNEYSIARDIRFRYSNVGPIMAAHAIGAKTGHNWRAFIRDVVLRPAGMNDSYTVMAEAETGPMTRGYTGAWRGHYEPEKIKSDAQMHAAGGMVSTAADLARWLIINLDEGRIDGEQALPRRAVAQTHAPQVQLSTRFLEYQRYAYGLGLYLSRYDGERLLHHFGGETHMSFMPERDLGVIVLANELDFGARVTHALAATIYDLLLGKGDTEDRSGRRLAEIENQKRVLRERSSSYVAEARARAATRSSRFEATQLAGTYLDPRLGAMSVAAQGEGLVVRYGVIEGALEALGGDTYLAHIGIWGGPPQVFAFERDHQGQPFLDWDGRIFLRRP